MQLQFDLERFEDAAKQNGIRYWIAHEFMESLGYETWSSFQKVINKAMASCAALNVQIQEVFIPDTFIEEGKEVSMLVFGSSMAPFLIHARDMIYFKKPDRELQKGDIVFFRRKSGQFVMHRIWKIRPEGYYIVGDAQTQIEGPVKREQIFALITKVRRKEKWLEPGDFWWEFFEHVWLHMIPLRRGIMWCYAKVIR